MAPNRLVNLRDVASASPTLLAGVLLRSDAPLDGDEHKGYPVAWPPATIIDLRDPHERGGHHPLAEHGRVVELPLLRGAPYDSDHADRTLQDLYLTLLESPISSELLIQAVNTIAFASGPVLVHCTAGKDRTGITVALTLRLLNVSHEEILADYVRTAEVMESVRERMSSTLRSLLTPERIAALPSGVHATPVEAMTAFLDALERAGGAEAWFLAHGGEPEVVAALCTRLLAESVTGPRM